MKSHITKKKHFKNKKKRFTRRLKNKKYMKGGAIESSSTPPIKPVPPTPPVKEVPNTPSISPVVSTPPVKEVPNTPSSAVVVANPQPEAQDKKEEEKKGLFSGLKEKYDKNKEERAKIAEAQKIEKDKAKAEMDAAKKAAEDKNKADKEAIEKAKQDAKAKEIADKQAKRDAEQAEKVRRAGLSDTERKAEDDAKKAQEKAKKEADNAAKKEADAKKQAEKQAQKQAQQQANAAKKAANKGKGSKFSKMLGSMTSNSGSSSGSMGMGTMSTVSDADIQAIQKHEENQKVDPLQNWGIKKEDIPDTHDIPDNISPDDAEALEKVQTALEYKYKFAKQDPKLAKQLKQIKDSEKLSTLEQIALDLSSLPGQMVRGYIDFLRAMVLGFKNQMLTFQKTSETQVLNAQTMADVAEKRAKMLGVDIVQEGGAETASIIDSAKDEMDKAKSSIPDVDLLKDSQDELNKMNVTADDADKKQKKEQEKASKEYADEYVEKNKKILISIMEKVISYLLLINELKKTYPDIESLYDIPLEELKKMLKETASKEVRDELKEKEKLLTEHMKQYIDTIVKEQRESIIKNSELISNAINEGYLNSINAGIKNVPLNMLGDVLGTLSNAAVSPLNTAVTEQMAPFATAANSFNALNQAIENNLNQSEKFIAAEAKNQEDILESFNKAVIPPGQSGGKIYKTKKYHPISFRKMKKTRKVIKKKENKLLKSVNKFTNGTYNRKTLQKKFKKYIS